MAMRRSSIWRRIATWFKVLFIEIVLRLKGWRSPRGPMPDRAERRRIMRQRGLVSQIYIRRALLEHRRSTRRERQRLAAMKLAPIKHRLISNPKKARRKFKAWYDKLMREAHEREALKNRVDR